MTKSKLVNLASGTLSAAVVAGLTFIAANSLGMINGLGKCFNQIVQYSYDVENPKGTDICFMEDYGINPTKADANCRVVVMMGKNSFGEDVYRPISPKN